MCEMFPGLFCKKNFEKKNYGFRQKSNFHQKYADFEHPSTSLHAATYLELKSR